MKKEVMKYLQQQTRRKRPRRYLMRMFDLACLYLAQVDEYDLKLIRGRIHLAIWVDPEGVMYKEDLK